MSSSRLPKNFIWIRFGGFCDIMAANSLFRLGLLVKTEFSKIMLMTPSWITRFEEFRVARDALAINRWTNLEHLRSLAEAPSSNTHREVNIENSYPCRMWSVYEPCLYSCYWVALQIDRFFGCFFFVFDPLLATKVWLATLICMRCKMYVWLTYKLLYKC